MSLKKVNLRVIILILMMIAASAMRLITYKFPYELSNFTPMGAIALFGGAYFRDKWKGYVLVLITLFGSDILVNYLHSGKWVIWYDGVAGMYIAFVLMVFIGGFIKKINVANIGIASLISVAIHWLITDLPWLYSTSFYPHNLKGYGQSLVAAIYPFEVNMLLADIVFCAILFGGFEFAKNKYTVLRNQKELAV